MGEDKVFLLRTSLVRRIMPLGNEIVYSVPCGPINTATDLVNAVKERYNGQKFEIRPLMIHRVPSTTCYVKLYGTSSWKGKQILVNGHKRLVTMESPNKNC
jgi:hypothetical protein